MLFTTTYSRAGIVNSIASRALSDGDGGPAMAPACCRCRTSRSQSALEMASFSASESRVTENLE